jgi:demethylmenaquinone methyltransferase/2-methoxy-6-polyprenyl-1,4-benzoquinol methylase
MAAGVADRPTGRRDALLSRDAVRRMFDAVAPRYDLLNRVLSLGIDRRWRRRTIRALDLRAGDLLLDVCGGTGDLAEEARRRTPGTRALVVDLSARMLGVARRRCGTVVAGDAMRLPVASGQASAVVVGFGIRNVEDRAAALGEFRRVLAPGGRLAILEFGLPPGRLVRGPYRLYLHHVLPRVAALVTGAPDAYTYLGDSIVDFPDPARFRASIADAGFHAVESHALSAGIAVLYQARV